MITYYVSLRLIAAVKPAADPKSVITEIRNDNIEELFPKHETNL